MSEAAALRNVTAEFLNADVAHKPSAQSSRSAGTTNEQASAEQRTRKNYFVRHWRGELSLPVSYWINGMLAGIITTLVSAVIAVTTNFTDEFRPGIALAAESSIWIVTALIAAWQLVGIWRSATNYRRALKIFWGPVAKVMVVLGAAELIFGFAHYGAPQIKDLYDIYLGDTEMGSYAFRVLRDGKELEFSGGITFGAAKDFQRFLDAMGAVEVVHLDSPGGRIAEAERIGQLLRARHLITYVAKDCLSACTHIFLSGRERLISPQGRLGFHQPDSPGLTTLQRAELIEAEEQRLRQLGVSAAFARKAVIAPPDNMWFPSVAELIREHVATRVVDPFDFALSGIDLSEISPDAVRAQLTQDPMYAQIRKYAPEEYQQIVDTLEEGLRRGVSGSEMVNALKEPVIAAFLKLLPSASDEQILAAMRVFIKHTTATAAVDASDCYYSVRQREATNDQRKALLKKYAALDSEVWAVRRRIIESLNGERVRTLDDREASMLGTKLQSALRKRYGNDVDLFSTRAIPAQKHAKFCTLVIAYFEELLRWPPSDAAAFFRSVRLIP